MEETYCILVDDEKGWHKNGGPKMTSKSKIWSFIFILISGALILFPVIVNAEYAYRKVITVDHTKVPSTLTNFPVLVGISNDNDLKNHVTSANGYDLVFKDGSGTQLNHELEKWDGSTGTLVAWVKIPSLSSTTDTVIYMWYGDSGVTTSQENKTGVWDSNYKGVWHLKEATGVSIADSTSNGNTGTPLNAPVQTTGYVDGSLSFNGTTQYATTPITAVYQQFTLSAWIKPSSVGSGWPNIMSKNSFYATSWTDWPVAFFCSAAGTSAWIQISPGTDYSTSLLATTPTFTPDQWHHVVVTYNGSTLRAYADGAYNQVTGSYTLPSNSRNWAIGRAAFEYAGGVGNSIYKGSMDEVRICNVARSADWILTEYRSQSSPSTFYTVGSEIPTLDTTPPAVTAFVIPSLYNNLTVPITTFTATDNVGVTGYLVNESPLTPSVSDPNWSTTHQTQYTFSSDGNKTLYAWAKDAAGNISNSRSATVSLVLGRRIYVYDELNRLIQVIYEDGRKVTYTYDASGNRITLTNE